MRKSSVADAVIVRFDSMLRAAFGVGMHQRRPSPAEGLPESPMSASERRHTVGLMRVNHCGEVCAQALYVGQAALSRNTATRKALLNAAREEGDHLFWCAERLQELDSKGSRLNVFWFAGSFAIGVTAAAAGDKWSMGFVEETERQVVRHLQGHLGELTVSDTRSRAIVETMLDDEAGHAEKASVRGSAPLPGFVRRWMRLSAGVMTYVAYWV